MLGSYPDMSLAEAREAREIAARLLKVMGSDLAPTYGPERSVNAVPRRLADTRKAQALLGFGSTVNLDEGLARLVEWWQHNKAAVALT